MIHKKWVHSFFFYGMSFIGAVLFAVMVTADAHASGRDNDPPPVEVGQDQQQSQGQAQGQHQGQGQGQGQTATGTASNDGNSLDAGDNITNARTTFFSFNRSMPAAGRCFGTVDGGGGSEGGAGFLGINYLNKNCWYAALADAEQGVEVIARLKCGSKMFRAAIAYDSPRKKRQQDCVAFMINTYVEQLAFEHAQFEKALAAQATLIMDHTTKETDRTTNTLTRVVETCSDCYGEGSK